VFLLTENIEKKSNLGSWSYCKVFEGIQNSYGRGKQIATDAFNKVNGTQTYMQWDTCIQLTDENFPQGHPQVAQVAIQGLNLASNFKRILKTKQ
jgi:NADH dehydrogenase